MTHLCPDCGLEHHVDTPEPVVIDPEPLTDAAVEVARIEADRDVTIARLEAKTQDASDERWQENRVAELEGRLSGMQEILDRLAPPEPATQPVPIVVEEPAPEPVVEETGATPPPVVEETPKPSKKKNPWWG